MASVRREIIATMFKFHRAMENADVPALRQLVDPKYYLVHITGFKQPGEAWFDLVSSKRYNYHSIKVNEDAVEVTEGKDGATAIAHGRGVFDATIDGVRAPWKLEFTTHYAKEEGNWIIKHSSSKAY